MNFKKRGLFTGSKAVCEEPSMPEKGILAVWGSPGCGKTLASIKLAQHLASKKQNVLLVLCDMTTPMLPCVCPNSQVDTERSMGNVLVTEKMNQTLIKHNLTTLKKYKNLVILAMRKGENEHSYPAPTQEQAEALLTALRETAPYVIVDCSSYISSDVLSFVTLMLADHVLRLANVDLKSVSYFSGQNHLLRAENWDAGKQYKIASNVKPNQTQEQIYNSIGEVAFKLPYSTELEGQFLAGTLLDTLQMKDGRAYDKEIARISKEVFGC
ncbi:AAA family ATPase [Bengtsoniella intestinalis]|uniref:AAA family ATPase n=1 Tax=Bengtsoniella intestinalis TaxID=3073143 RepID=UPI00391F68BB